MDNQIRLLLNSEKNIESVNSDINTIIELNTAYSEIREYNLNNAVNSSIVFESERQNTPIYRIYGRIDYIALLNGLKSNYVGFQDFFLPQSGNCKTLLNSFKFWLVRPSSLTTRSLGHDIFVRHYDVIAKPENIEIYTVGFGTNIFGEQTYGYNLNIDIDISDYYDIFGFPVTELFLYAQYLPNTTQLESLRATTWDNFGIPSKINVQSINSDINETLNYDGSTDITDIVQYDSDKYQIEQLVEQVHYINTPVSAHGTVTFSYDVTAHANIIDIIHGDSATSLLYVQYSMDSGNTWVSINNVEAHADILNINVSSQITGTFTVTSTIQGFNGVRVRILDIYTIIGSAGTSNATGNGYIRVDSILMDNNSTVNILCNNKYILNGETATLVCDITPPPSNPVIPDIRLSSIGLDNSGIMISENYGVPNNNDVIWKYNPFIPLKLRYLANELNEVNTGSTYYTTLNTIPAHATNIGNNNYVWRNILPEGYIDPLTGDGNDIPFINKKRYFFETITLSISPDMDDTFTYNIFDEIEYTKNSTEINVKPIDTGTPCD